MMIHDITVLAGRYKNRKRVGRGKHYEEPEGGKPEQPAEAGGEAAVVAIEKILNY